MLKLILASLIRCYFNHIVLCFAKDLNKSMRNKTTTFEFD